MTLLITFLEGLISFISPCMLPMLPVYVSYFAGNGDKVRHTFARAVAFVCGFTVVFVLLGVFAGVLGTLLRGHQTIVNVVTGGVVVLFGLSYLEVIHLPFLRINTNGVEVTSVISAFLFGMIYSVSLTPCVGAFLGSALMLASSQGGAARGALLLFVYSMGLGVPFIISALILGKLSQVFIFIKSHYKIINTVCGCFLILIGILMAAGMMNRFMGLLV